MRPMLVATAVAVALAAPLAASASVTIDGTLHMSVDFTDNGSHGPLSPSNHSSVSSNNSVIALSGDEDLGNGMQALWRIENLVSLDEGGGNWASVNSYLGLAGAFGTVVLGQHDTPYFMFQNRFDALDSTLADLGTTMGNVSVSGNSYCTTSGGCTPATAKTLPGYELTTPNTIAYVSPDLNGVQVIAGYVTDSVVRGVEDNNGYDALSASLTYTNGGLMLGAAYERHNYAGPIYLNNGSGTYNVAVDPKTDRALSLGVTYRMNATDMGLLYETIQGNGFMDRDGWTAFLTEGFGNNTAKLVYSTVSSANTSAAMDGASMWGLGLFHDLSRRTSLYGMYAALNNDANSIRGLGGIDHGDVLSNAGGQDQTGFSLGMTHDF